MGGGNGLVLHNDSGETDWTASALDTVKVHGLEANSAIWTGSSWIVGSNLGIFRSVAGEEPWTRFNPGLGVMNWTALATHEGRVFAALSTGLGAVMEESDDDGATWRVNEVESGAFVQKLAVSGDGLFAARRDGLWRRPLAVTGVESAATPGTLRFAVAGPQPSGDPMRLRFDLPRSGAISIELFDVHGRLVGDRVEGNWASGRHEVALDAKRLGSGVFFARITADGRSQVVRLVRIR
jgi:hypothetical protein